MTVAVARQASVPSSAPLLEMLRSKAMLLLRREREVFQLRQERSRVELWLNVIHELSLDLHGRTQKALLDDWALAMVDKLSFQVAAAYECDPERGSMRLLAGQAHVVLAPEVPLDRRVQRTLRDARTGSRIGPESEALDALASAVGLESFFWQTLATRATNLLLITGFEASDTKLQALNQFDFAHFVFSGKHVAALLENIALIAELDRERSEIAASNAELDCSLQNLREAQGKVLQSSRLLAEVSRRAGMADIATGVLHNVGNVLNSVNVSAELAAERLRAMKISGVARVAELIERDLAGAVTETNEVRQARKVVRYLRELGGHLAGEAREIADELVGLQQNIDHIKSIVSKQQAYARTTLDVAEACSTAELMDDALGLAMHAVSQIGIEVVRDYVDPPVMLVDRHKVLQILVNLVSNAKHALADSAAAHKVMTLSIRAVQPNRVRLSVSDNGVGIAREHLPKLFTHGFTTRDKGHGFGLHTSALSAREMGGELTGHSAGPDRGATFVLELPAQTLSPSELPP